MLLTIRIFLVLYGLIALGTGILGITASYEAGVAPFEDNSHRFIAAIWASTSLAFFYVARYPAETALFRFLMIALFLGGVVRAVACLHYTPDVPILATIILELVPTPILWWMHSRLLSDGTLL